MTRGAIRVRSRRRVKKVNLRLSDNELRAVVKLALGADKLTPGETSLVTAARKYMSAKLAIRERGSSSYDDDDEFG